VRRRRRELRSRRIQRGRRFSHRHQAAEHLRDQERVHDSRVRSLANRANRRTAIRHAGVAERVATVESHRFAAGRSHQEATDAAFEMCKWVGCH
jgi:hypothetical protein